MAAHSKIGASSYHRWSVCPGSVKLCEKAPNLSSKYADEGTLAHEIAAAMLLGTYSEEDVIVEPEPEMLEAVKVYVDFVIGLRPTATKILVEHQFNLSAIYPGLFGTADAVLYHADKKLLRVIDYKHGAGIAVEVLEDGEANLQLVYYALGALVSLKLPVDHVEITIVQPRCPHPNGPIRSHLFNAIELLDFATDLIEAAKRTEEPSAPLVPGDHCGFCNAKGMCPKLHEKSLQLAQEVFSPQLSYDPKKLSETLSMLDAVEAWVKGVREFAYAEAQHGRPPPGWKLVQKRATRKWKDEEEARRKLIAKADLNYETAMTLPELKSPAQIEKLIDKKHKPLLEELVVSVSSGVTLAPETDKRPAISAAPKDVFEVLN